MSEVPLYSIQRVRAYMSEAFGAKTSLVPTGATDSDCGLTLLCLNHATVSLCRGTALIRNCVPLGPP